MTESSVKYMLLGKFIILLFHVLFIKINYLSRQTNCLKIKNNLIAHKHKQKYTLKNWKHEKILHKN